MAMEEKNKNDYEERTFLHKGWPSTFRMPRRNSDYIWSMHAKEEWLVALFGSYTQSSNLTKII